LQIQNLKSKIQNMIDGILIIDKPAGFTSHDVVAKTRRILKTKRVGHTGTLDPFATGVIVILVGRATRLAQFLDKDIKEYEAVVRFGFETNTGDFTGSPKESRITNYELRITEIKNALENFRGEIRQTPPMFSAKKVGGKKLYELARKGIEIEREPVRVKIYEIEIIEPQIHADEHGLKSKEQKTKDKLREATPDSRLRTSDLKFRVVCSAGTYIRTLAEDIGKKIGIGAHLVALRRIRAGRFNLSKSITLEKLEEIVSSDKHNEIFISMSEAVSHLPEIKLSTEEVLKVKNGMKLTFEIEDVWDNQAIRLLDENNNLVAVGIYERAEKFVQPKIVLL